MSHTLLYFIIRVGNGLLAITILAVLTRLLSPSEYGIYALLVAVATVMSSILYQWLNAAVGRFYPMHLDDPRKITAVVARGFWAVTAVAAVLYLGALPLHKLFNIEPVMIGLLFLMTVAMARYTLALQIANSQRMPACYSKLSWAKSGVALLASIFFINFGLGGQGALLGFLVGLVVAVLIFEPRPRIGLPLGNVNTRLSSDMFRYGLPLTLNFLAIVLLDLVDRFMIGHLLGVAYIAPYAVAYDLVQLTVGSVMNIFLLSAFPVIVHLFDSEGYKSASVNLRVLGGKLISVGLPLAAGLSVLSSDISKLLFGIEYQQDASMVMPWLTAAIFVATFKSYFLDVVFQLHHATKYQSYIAIMMLLVNVALNLVLLPRYGIIAAAWATLAAFLVGTIMSWIIAKKIFSVPSLSDVFWKVAFATAIMAALLYFLPPSSGVLWLLAKLA